MVLRIVLIAVVVFLLLAWLRSLRRRVGSQRGKQDAAGSSQRMVRCAHCAMHLPAEEALTDGAKHFCSIEHRDAARRTGPGS